MEECTFTFDAGEESKVKKPIVKEFQAFIGEDLDMNFNIPIPPIPMYNKETFDKVVQMTETIYADQSTNAYQIFQKGSWKHQHR